MDEIVTPTADTPSSGSSAPPPSAPAADPIVTTDRPPIKTALETFNEAAKAQGKRTYGQKNKITGTGEPSELDAATTQPEGTTAAVDVKGPVPFETHHTALDNARKKATTEAETKFRQTHGEAIKWFDAARQNRTGFTLGLLAEALQDPQLGPQIARMVGSPTAPTTDRPAAPTQAPAPDFQDGQGNQFYSARAQQARDEWLIAKVKADILGEVKPDLDSVREDRERREVAKADQQRATQIRSHISEAKTWPHFSQFEAEIKAAVLAMPLTDGHPASEAAVLQRAYWQVVGPQISALEQQRVVKDLKARANSNSVNPAATGAPSGIPKSARAKDGGTMAEALKWAATQTAGR